MSSRSTVLCVLTCLSASVLAAVVVSCTSGTTPNCADAAACGPGFDGPPTDASLGDALEASEASEASDEGVDGPEEAGDAISDAPSDAAAVGCHRLFGEGSAEECNFITVAKACPKGFKEGSCPPAKLTGCCVTLDDAGGAKAVCFYQGDVPDASVEEQECTTAGNKWVKTAP